MEQARAVAGRRATDARIVSAILAMTAQIDRTLGAKGDSATNVTFGRGGIREIEFLVQALQLLYGGDDSWLRERNTLKVIFRLSERGYLAPDLGRMLSEAYAHLRTVEHRLQILHEFQTHTLPSSPLELGRLARRVGIAGPPAQAARAFRARHRRITATVHRAFRAFFAERVGSPGKRLRLPSVMALAATGFADPQPARHNPAPIPQGPPPLPYPGRPRAALPRP